MGKSMIKYLTTIVLLILINETVYCQGGGGAGGGSNAGGGGAGGGQNTSLMAFKYKLLPSFNKSNSNDSIHRGGNLAYFKYKDSCFEVKYDIQENKYKIKFITDSVYINKHKKNPPFFHKWINKIEKNFFNLVFVDTVLTKERNTKRIAGFTFDTTFNSNGNIISINKKADSIIEPTFVFKSHRIKYEDQRNSVLKVVIINRYKDTVMFIIWPPEYSKKFAKKGDTITQSYIDGIADVNLYNNDNNKHGADTLYFINRWSNTGITKKFQTFNLTFRTRYFIPVSIPLIWETSSGQYVSSFLNAGMAYGWAFGRSKFYKDNIQNTRNAVIGFGPIAGISALTITNSNISPSPNPKDTTVNNTNPMFYWGGHCAITLLNSVSIILTGGFQNGLGKGYVKDWLYNGKPFIGIGIGLSLFNISIPSVPNSQIPGS